MAGFISGNHFYHATTRKIVSVFGSLFNNISLIRKDSSGNVLNIEKVPLAYGPAQKFLSRIEEQADLTDPRMAIKLPRISFEMVAMNYDPTFKVNRFNNKLVLNDDGSRSKVQPYVPYILNFEVNILVKAQDDGLQILEQILPTFHPEYTVSVKYTEEDTADMPITLEGVSINDDYEGDYLSRRVLMYTLNFSIKARYYGEITDAGPVIKETFVDFWDTTKDTNQFLEAYVSRVDPFDSTEDDDYQIFESYPNVPTSFQANLVISNLTGEFQANEIIFGNHVGRGLSFAVDNDAEVMTIKSVAEYFRPGEIIEGDTSGATATVVSVTLTSDE